MENDLAVKHPRFQGNWEDLRQFLLLCSSPIRSPAREDALRTWERYKLSRQFASVPPAKKGAHMRALISRVIDLSGADLDEICVGYADLRGVILNDCSLRGAWLKAANLENASLCNADFSTRQESGRGAGRLLYSNLCGADLTGCNLSGVDLSFAELNDATLDRANLSDADLSHAAMVRTRIAGAVLVNTRIYGISAWDLQGSPALQQDLIITPPETLGAKRFYYALKESQPSPGNDGTVLEPRTVGMKEPLKHPAVTVDNLEVAQFVYLLMHNEKIRDVLDTIGAKGVLILGRFTADRKPILDGIRSKLRELGYVPMMFDFERPTQRDFTETIKILAGLSRFIIADISNPRSSPLELEATMPEYMIPFVPIIDEREEPFAMFRDLKQKYGDWVLDILKYDSPERLLMVFENAVVRPALETSERLVLKKAEAIRTRHVSDYLKPITASGDQKSRA